ncbi:MAG: chemotaxis protein CheA [Chroococcidiopsidaceae cyanobacterium CP_BM_RX_35]|nr:chemotaxis protein CheA [Chroococcidiopsidaceae cyanobacterium CP_BM_RX_35]
MESVEIDEDIKAFLVESAENLSQIEQEVVSLETTNQPQDILIRIYRSLHTIKGNCGFLSFPKLEAVAHAGETLLSDLREHPSTINTKILNALLQMIDRIRQLLTQIEGTGAEGDGDDSALIQHLTQRHEANHPSNATQLDSVQQQASTAIAQPLGYQITTGTTTLTAIESSVRVNLILLDQVMDLVGELVLARNQVLQHSTMHTNEGLSTACQRLDQITAALQASVMKTRMQPLGTLWQHVPRMVRDLAMDCGKQIYVVTDGAETELDKSILEAIKDPLTQLIRNCIDHGIELPDVRLSRGKPAAGRLSLRAFHANGKVNLEISDDGNGIDPERLKQRAQQLGVMTHDQVGLSHSEVLDLMFLPGFSTASQITKLSGRGMGMDIVRSNLEKLNGSIEVQSQVGQGTTFRLKLPLTLTIISALIVTSGGERFAIPQSSIQELVRFPQEQAPDRIATLYDVPVYRLRDKLLSLLYLNQELQLADKSVEEELVSIVVVQAEDYPFGLVVDAIEDTQGIVVKPLSHQLETLSMFAGATILGDGTVALILDASGIAAHAKLTAQQLAQSYGEIGQTESGDHPLILLVEGTAGARMGIPLKGSRLAAPATQERKLNSVLRLEQFAPTAVEKIGNQYVVPYGSQVLPLIDLCPLFSQQERSLADATLEVLQVVVVSLPNKNSVGLVVETVLDIVEDSLAVKGAASRAGVSCNAMIQGEVTEILDLEAIIQMTNPYLLHAS